MSWSRLGVVYVPDGTRPWARSHAALPFPVQIGTNVFRIFFSARDDEQRSHVGWADIDLSSTPRVLREATEPVLSPGVDGTFDDSGIGIGCMTSADDGVRIYYMGWNLGVRSRWHNAIGVAQARTPIDRFERFSPGPILDRSPEDPYTLSYPCVVRRGLKDWWMWYGSNLTPDVSNEGLKHVIKLCRSSDGFHWLRDGAVALGFGSDDEYAMARPSVVESEDGFLMCFACRGDHYHIGCARSADGLAWTRIDGEMGLDTSSEGWDSEMTCYPALFHYGGTLWLVYNGNGYGSTGFGLAVWQSDIPSNGG